MSSEGNENVVQSGSSPKRSPRSRRSQDLDANTLARDDAPAEDDQPPEDYLPPEVTTDEGEVEVPTQSENEDESSHTSETYISNSDSGTMMIIPPPPARSESYPDGGGAGDKDGNPPPFTSDLIQHQHMGQGGASDCPCECHGWSGQDLPCYNCAMGNKGNPCKRSKPSSTTRPQGPIAVVMTDFLQSGVGGNGPSDDAISTVTTSPKCSIINNGCLSSTLIDLFVIAALLLILMMVPLGFLHIRLDVWLILGFPIYIVFGGVLISFTDSKKFYISTALCGFSFLLGNLYIWTVKKAVAHPGYQILPWAIYCVSVSIVIVKCNIKCGSALYTIRRTQSQMSVSLGNGS